MTVLLSDLVLVSIYILVVTVLLIAIRILYSFYYQFMTGYSLLELTPPAFTDRPALATESLFTTLHGLGMTRSFVDRLLGRKDIFSVEIVSTRKQGIRFIVRTPSDKANTVEQLINSYLPEVKIKTISDYIADTKGRIYEFKQTKHFSYPLKSYDELTSHDPIGYITSSMTKLNEDELIAYQVVFTPERVRAADSIRGKILKNDSFMPDNKSRSWTNPLLDLLNKALFSIADTLSTVYHGPSNYDHMGAQRDLEYKKQVAKDIKPVRSLSYFEHELVETISQKLSRPLFRTSIRIYIVSSTKKDLVKHKKSLSSAISLFTVPKYQSLKLKRRTIPSSALRLLYKARMSTSKMYLSANELAGLYHFPNSDSAKTENVMKSLSKTLPAPVSLKNNTKLDILIGKNVHHGQTTPIGLTKAERERHVYVIGGTGNGKTTMLKYQIVQDIRNGKGVAVIDPHGDLAEEILCYIPKERMKDVVYINPDDLARPVGINLLEMREGLTGDELLREKDLVTESTVSVLRKIFSEDDTGGHRIEYVLRNTIQTALTMDECNLFTIFRLLNDKKYRKNIVNNLENEDLKIFWKNEIGKAGEMQKIKMAAGITSKIGRFLFSASARRMMEQNKSTVDFDSIMDDKKILICNFSKGLLGEDTSMLFGVTILAKIQLASLRRARQTQSERTPYYLYVDEFQNFATMGFVQMLSEARKYQLFLTMAEQSTSQQEDQRLVDIILANVGTVVAFRSGSPADERLILPLFTPYVGEGEISNLPAYNYYIRIAAVETQEPMSGVTVLLDQKEDRAMTSRIKALSRKTYGTEPISTVVESGNPTKSVHRKPKRKARPKVRKANKPTKELT